jgi:RNA polymerase sigma-70 factor, ECF subfamily
MTMLNFQCPLAAPPAPHDEPSVSPLPAYDAEQVFHLFAPRVYSLARRMLGNAADADDVTQDVLLQVVRKLATFRGDSELSTWLHRVTVNAALAHRRRQARRPELNLETSLDSLPGRPSSHQEMPERTVLGSELRQHLELAISGLPCIYRDVFVLADIEDLGNAEICKLLGLSLPAVKSRLHRARLMIRDAITPYLDMANVD